MTKPSLELIAATDAQGGTVLKSPRVGVWSDLPADGAVVQAGGSAGTLTQLGRRFTLLVPDEVAGRAVVEARPDVAVPVAYGEVLVRVAPFAAGEGKASSKRKAAARAPGGALEVVAPTAGVFYRAPGAGAKPYVAPGERIKKGQPVGLIEVMKTFNPIAFAGPGLPEEALVVEVLAGDGQEVRAGQALLTVKAV